MKLDRLLALVALLISLVALIVVLQIRSPQQETQIPEPAFSAAEAQKDVDRIIADGQKWAPIVERCRRYAGRAPGAWAQECQDLPPLYRIELLPRKQQDLLVVCLKRDAAAFRAAAEHQPPLQDTEIPLPAECEPLREYVRLTSAK